MDFWLYHRVPDKMWETFLYPLNTLKDINPELYGYGIMKYTDRPAVPKKVIPHFNCLWNDVLFLAAVSPQAICEALLEAGHQRCNSMKCYQIDPELLEKKKMLVYLYSQDRLNPNMAIDQD